ncbi:6903_t:CDS:1, partial [Acaulospora morrowiae]
MVEWTDTQIRILIDERRNRNEEYHNFGRNRIRFWNNPPSRDFITRSQTINLCLRRQR